MLDDISKQIGELEALFSLVAYSEMHSEKLRKEWLNIQEPVPVGLGNSQPIQIDKEPNINRFSIRKVGSRDKNEGCGYTTFS